MLNSKYPNPNKNSLSHHFPPQQFIWLSIQVLRKHFSSLPLFYFPLSISYQYFESKSTFELHQVLVISYWSIAIISRFVSLIQFSFLQIDFPHHHQMAPPKRRIRPHYFLSYTIISSQQFKQLIMTSVIWPPSAPPLHSWHHFWAIPLKYFMFNIFSWHCLGLRFLPFHCSFN